KSERRKMIFAYCAKSVVSSAANGRLRELMLRALSEDWVLPRYLTQACVSITTLNGFIKEAIERAQTAWPQRLSITDLFGAAGFVEVVRDELLCRLLETDPITDLRLERLLANIRRAMLKSAYVALCGALASSPSLPEARDDLGAFPVGSEADDSLL